MEGTETNLSSLVVVLPSVLINSVAVSYIALGTGRLVTKEWGTMGEGGQRRRKPTLVNLSGPFMGGNTKLGISFKYQILN